jgi:hypothetical protein
MAVADGGNEDVNLDGRTGSRREVGGFGMQEGGRDG